MICALNPHSMSVKKALYDLRNMRRKVEFKNPQLSLSESMHHFPLLPITFISLCKEVLLCMTQRNVLFSLRHYSQLFCYFSYWLLLPCWDWNVLKTSFFSKLRGKCLISNTGNQIFNLQISLKAVELLDHAVLNITCGAFGIRKWKEREYTSLYASYCKCFSRLNTFISRLSKLLLCFVKAESDQEEKSRLLQTTFLS